jgi:uroporphyrinogen III methyltransferase / synthase
VTTTSDLTPNVHETFNPQQPLSGRTILVTRAVGQSSQFSDRLQRLGATVIEMPALEIGPPTNWEALDSAIAKLDTFDWLILTSTNGVDYFFERLATQIQDIRALAAIKIAVVGEKTAQRLKQRGLQADFVPPNFMADFLIAHFPDRDLTGKRILFPRVESGGRDVLMKEFAAKGAEVVEVAAYESRCPQEISAHALEAIQKQSVDLITFASAKTVKYFCQLVEQAIGADWQTDLAGVYTASIGPQTSKACQTLLGHVDVEAQEYTLEGLAQAIVQWAQTKP